MKKEKKTADKAEIKRKKLIFFQLYGNILEI